MYLINFIHSDFLPSFNCPQYCHCDFVKTILSVNCDLDEKIPRNFSLNHDHELERRVTFIEINAKLNLIESLNLCAFYNLQSLEFHDNNFDNETKIESKCLTNIKKLNLSHNRITKLNIDTFSFESNLEIIDLGNNKIEEIKEKNIFENLQSVKQLLLPYNNIKNISSDSFEFLQNLLSIDLSHNQLLEIDCKIFRFSKNLKEINLTKNFFEKIDSFTFSSIEYLEVINLSNNKINQIEMMAFYDLPNLKIIDLSKNKIKELSSNSFKKVPSLSYFYLSNNQLTNIESQLFRNLKDLKHLDLSNNRISETTKVFHNLTNLQSLVLSNNLIEKLTPDFFSNLPRLEYLNMNRNKIKEIPVGLFQIFDFPSIKELDLSNNFLTEMELWPLYIRKNRFDTQLNRKLY